MRDVTSYTANHDNVHSNQHDRDKAEKLERDQFDYKQVPALAREAGSKIVDGFKSYTKGWSWRLIDGVPVIVDAKGYTKELIRLAKERSHFKRPRTRGERETYDPGQYKSGAVSLVTTVAPWCVDIISELSAKDQERLFLRLAKTRASSVMRVSGRPVHGGGFHADTAIPHFHDHIFKTDENRNIFPKAKFKTAGPWLVGAYRIHKRFPTLLSQKKKDMMVSALSKKDLPHLVDIQVSLAMDNDIENFFIDEGLYAKYEAACNKYSKRKKKAQEEEQYKGIIKASLEHFQDTGIWPIFYRLMKLAMWRLIPKPLRKPIQTSIRLFQFIKKEDDDSNGDGTLDGISLKQNKKLNILLESLKNISIPKVKLPGNLA